MNIFKNNTNVYPKTEYGKYFTTEQAKKTVDYHRSFEEYSVTPLVELKGLAKNLDLDGFYIKDESYRFGLNAFKVLGGSFAIGNYIAKRLGMDISELTSDKLTSKTVKDELGDITFITATDGNHGRGVAWTANRLGQKSIVYMPKGTASERLENIRKLGSQAYILDLDYDDCVRLAGKKANEEGMVLIQDTVYGENTHIPLYVMQGYMTMVHEAIEQLNGVRPTHIFLQAGVGSMAATVTAYVSNFYGDYKPIIVIVEPHSANCLYLTAKAEDGELHACEGEMNSMMAGLCCGEVCPMAWDILRKNAEYFITISDDSAAKGMRALYLATDGDRRVISGESGASTTGAVIDIMTNPECEEIKKELSLNESSVVLCFSTEGDTDKENFQEIVKGRLG